jgi:ferredoxin
MSCSILRSLSSLELLACLDTDCTTCEHYTTKSHDENVAEMEAISDDIIKENEANDNIYGLR